MSIESVVCIFIWRIWIFFFKKNLIIIILNAKIIKPTAKYCSYMLLYETIVNIYNKITFYIL